MAVLKSLLLLGRACSSSSLLIGSLPSSLHNRLSSSRFHPFSANSPPAADRKHEIPFPEDLPSYYTKVDGGEECMSLTRKTKDEINVKTHIMHHDAQQDHLSVSDDSNVRDAASFNWIGDFDDVFVVDDDKIVYLGKRKLEGEGEGEGGGDEGGGGGGEHGDGDDLSVSDDSNVRDASSNWIGDIDDEYIVVDDKIVFLGKFKVKRKLENIGEGEGEGEGEGGGGGDQGESGGGDHRRSIWMRLKDFFKKRGI